MDSGKYLVINMTVMSPRPKGDSCGQLGSEATSSEPDGPEGRSRWGWDVQDEAARTPCRRPAGLAHPAALPAALGERWTQRTITVDA